MKTKSFLNLILTALLLAGLFAALPARAQNITWGAAQNISGDTDVANSGTPVCAFCFNAAQTINGVTFALSATTPPAWLGTVSSSPNIWFGTTVGGSRNTSAFGPATAPFSGLSAAYKAVLQAAEYASSQTGPQTIILTNLTVGHSYQVQFWVNDARGSTRTDTLTSAGGNSVTLKFCQTGSAGSPGQFAIGTFTASTTTQTFTVTADATGQTPQMNAIQLLDQGLAPVAVAPIISPAAGTDYIPPSLTVTITGESGATVFYTTDGSNPTNTSANGGVGTGSATITLSVPGTVTVNAYETNNTQTDSAIASSTYALLSPASAVWTNLAGSSWTMTNNWSPNVAAGGIDATANFSTLTLTNAATVTLDGARPIGNLVFGDVGNTYGWTLSTGSAGPLTLAVSSGSPTITVNNQTNTLGVVLAGTNGLTKAGAGTLTLSGASLNTYTGTTTVAAGTLIVDNNSGGTTSMSSSGYVVDGASTLFFKATAGSGTRNDMSGKTFTFDSVGGGMITNTVGNFLLFGTITTGGGAQDTITGNGINMNSGAFTFNLTRGTGTRDLLITPTFGNSSALVTLTGNGILALTGVETYTGATTIGSGSTLVIAGAGQLGSGSYAGLITNNGVLNYNSSANQTLSGVVSGSGNLTASGPGTLTLSGASTYTGPTLVSAGKLVVSSAATINNTITVNDNAGLGVTVSGSLQLSPATLTEGSSAGPTTNEFTGVTSTTVAPINTPNLVLNGTTTINILSGTFSPAGGIYPLISYTSISGAGGFKVGTLPAGVGATVITNGSSIALNVFATDIWVGNLNGTWDIATTANWNLGNYTDGYPVRFDDTATTSLVTNTVTVSPAGITVSNVVKNYTLSGSPIAGIGQLVKQGIGTLTLLNANTYSGGTALSVGKLALGSTTAIGTGPLTITGGTNANVSGAPMTLANNNAENWNGSFVFAGTNDLNLGTGNVTLGAAVTVTVVTNTLTVGGNITGGNNALTLTGAGTLTLPAGGALNNGSGALNISGFSTLRLNGGSITNSGGVSVGNGATDIGTFQLDSGTYTQNGSTSFVLGSTLGANNVFNQTGGTFNYPCTANFIMDNNGGLDTVNLSAGTFTMTGSGTALQLGQRGIGIVNISGSAVVTTPRVALVGWTTSTNAGTVNLNGGTLITPLVAKTVSGQTASGTATFNFNGGTLQASAAANPYLTGLNTANVRNGGAVINDGGFAITISQALLHSSIGGDAATDGGLTKQGIGTLTLSGANTYTGPTLVSAGTLAVTSAQTTTNSLTIADASTLSVTVSGTSQLQPASLAEGSSIGGATNTFALVSSTSVAPVKTGTLTLKGMTTVNILSGTFSAGQTYPLINYTGIVGTGGFTVGALPGGVVATIVTNGNNIALNVTVAPIYLWTAAVNGNWNIATTANWSTNGGATTYPDGSTVWFDDTAAITSVTNTVTVSPGSMTVSNNSKSYTFSGTNITGTGNLTKRGTGTMTITNAESFAGLTTIANGTLQVGAGGLAGLLTTSAITNNGALVYNLSNTNSINSPVTGTGTLSASVGNATIGILGPVSQSSVSLTSTFASSVQALYGSAYAAAINLFTNITTTGNQTYNGVVSIGRGSSTSFGTTLTTTGGGSVSLPDGVVSGLSGYQSSGNLTIDTSAGNGTVTLGGTAMSYGVGNLNINSGSGLITLTGGNYNYDYSVFNGNVALTGSAGFVFSPKWVHGVQFNGDVTGSSFYLTNTFGTGGSGSTGTGTPGLIFNTAASQNVSVNLMGTSGLIKSGSGVTTLSGADIYTGATTVSNGTLVVSGIGSLTGSSAVTVQTNATLAGTGTISSPVSLNGGGRLAVGTDVSTNAVLGTMNLGSTLTLNANSTNLMRISKNGGTTASDLVNGWTGTLNYAGTLVVANVTGDGTALAVGDTFILFTGSGSYGNSFNNYILPVLPPSLSWDISQLAVNGSIAVVNTAATPSFTLGGPLGAQTVTISCLTPGAIIYYTTNGTTPTTSSPVYSTPISLPLNTTVTINAFAKASGFANSAVVSATYTLYPEAIWANTAGGSWPIANNWSNNAVGQGSGVTADFSELALPGAATVTLDGATTIGNLIFGDVNNGSTWTINNGSGGPLTLDAGTNTPTITVTNQTTTISTVIAGTNGFTFNGPGALTLSGTISNSGPMTVNGGTLTLLTTVTSQTYNGTNIYINNASILNIQQNRYNFANTFIFDTNGGGTLNDNANGYGGFVFMGDNTFVTTGGAQDIIGGSYGFNLNSSGRAIFNVARSTNVTSDLALQCGSIGLWNAGGIVKVGNGIMELDNPNAFTGATTVSNGTLIVASSGTIANGGETVSGGKLQVDGTVGSGALTVQSGGTLGGANGTINGPVTIQNGGTLMTDPAGVNNLTINNTLNLAGNARLQINSDTPSADYVNSMSHLTYGGTLTVTNLGATPLALGNSFSLFQSSAYSGSFTSFNLPPLTGGLSWDVSQLTVNGTISVINVVATPAFSPPAGGYVVTQALAVTISSQTAGATIHYSLDNWVTTNTYTTPIAVAVGTNLTIQAYATAAGYTDSGVASAAYATEPVAVWTNPGGGSWSYAGYWTNNIIPNNSGAMVDFSQLTLPADTFVNLDGAWTVGNLVFGDAGTNYTWEIDPGGSGSLTLNAGTNRPVINVLNQATVITAPISGANGLTKTGNGTLALAADNNYSGGTTISQGALELTNYYAASADPITLGDANTGTNDVQLVMDAQIGNTINVSTNGTGTNSITFTQGGGFYNYSYYNLSRPVTINAPNATSWVNLVRPMSGNVGTLTFNATNIGDGICILSAGNTFTGTIVLASGNMSSYPTSLGTANPVVMNGGTYNLLDATTPGVATTIGSLNGSGTIRAGYQTGAAPNQMLSIGNDNGSGSFSGVIANGGDNMAVIKTGTGTETLSGANTYTGATTVSNGTLIVNGSLAAGSAVTVTANGTLAGVGTISGVVTNNGTLAPGVGGIGALTINNNLTLVAGSTMTLAIDRAAGTGTYGKVQGVGTANLAGTLTVTSLGGTFQGGDSFNLVSATSYSGNFTSTNLPSLSAGLRWNWIPTTGVLTVVGPSVNTNPTNLTAVVSGGTLSLSWPADHTGWRLLVQTNHLAAGISSNTNDWMTVPGSAGIDQTNILMDPTKPAEFYRLVYP
jgi:autotransporter-associated beta strand protein